MLANVDLSNLLYLAGALVAATVVSALYLLRHRRPRSMESGINEFSRELRALAPDGGASHPASTSTPGDSGSYGIADRAGRARRDRARTRARDSGDSETG